MKAPTTHSQRGFTLVEILVALLISSLLLMGIVSAYGSSTKWYRDRQIRSRVDERARMLLDTLAYDIRMLGAGLPIAQTDFPIGGSSFGDAPLPILTTSTASKLVLRFNQQGKDTLITDDFDPSLHYDFYVLSAANFQVNDWLYISNMIPGGKAALRGQIASISGNQITLKPTAVWTGGATFLTGSSVEHVSDVTLESAGGSVMRKDEHSDAILMDNAQFSVSYLDRSGTALTLPLTDVTIRDQLSSVSLTVTVTSNELLSNGETYEATATQEIMLRNLVLTRLS